ncbi:MAG: OsmC family protein [Chitinophagaceae bacterium]
MKSSHHYHLSLQWTGNTGKGTVDYDAYSRDHIFTAEGKPELLGSSDKPFRGDAARYNPEELLLASLSSCHMLWYLHLCAVNKIIVLKYYDIPEATMEEEPDGSGKFREAILKPEVTVADEKMISTALKLHHEANKKCFIANSINFPIYHQPVIRVKEQTQK